MTVAQGRSHGGLADERQIRPSAASQQAPFLRWLRITVLPPFLVVIVLLALWQLSELVLDPILISTPTRVVAALASMSKQGTIWLALLTSLEEMFVGLGIGLVVGIVIGLLMGRYWTMEKILSPYVN